MREALKGSDLGAVKSAVEKLTTDSQELGQAIYASAAAAEGDGAAAAGGADDVVDAEVVDEGAGSTAGETK